MRFFRNRLSILIIVLMMLTVLSTGAINRASQASAASIANQAVVLSDEPGGGEISPRSASADWTPASSPWSKERMLLAKPYPLVEHATKFTSSSEAEEPSGTPGLIPSSGPQGNEISSLAGESADFISRPALLDEAFPFSGVPPYTSFRNFDSYQRFPYSTVGVLFFSQNDVDYQCTAASIGHDAVWTAGRCIHSGDGTGDGWSSDVVFVPAFKDGAEPYSQWSAYNLWTKGQWYFSADPSFDMGGAKLNPNGEGKTISQVVGSLGFSYNLSEYQAWFNVGYPDEPPFDGNWQYVCASSYGRSDTNQSVPYPIAMGCDMNGGSTGSPWIRNFSGSSGSSNFLNGNYSYQSPVDQDAIYSPYFGDAAKSLWDKLMAHKYLPVIIKE